MNSVIRSRLKAATIHLALSVMLALVIAAIVFPLWYPKAFARVAGGFELFILIVCVDVAMGPLMTAVIFDRRKPRRELIRDVSVIAILQFAALFYGLHAIFEARPVLLSFEIDRFRLVSAADVQVDQLQSAPEGYRTLSLSGPRLIAAAKPRGAEQQLRSIDLGLSGIDLSMVPGNWRPYSQFADEAVRRARPVEVLLGRYPGLATDVSDMATAAGVRSQQLRFLPLLSRKASWVILIEPVGGRPVGYLPVDGFF